MENITPDQLMNTVVVLLAIFAAIVTVDKVIDIIKKWRSPSTDTMKKLENDKQRLDEHDDAIRALQESSRVQLGALMALLDHELHNGNGDQMQKARDDINAYLQNLVAK